MTTLTLRFLLTVCCSITLLGGCEAPPPPSAPLKLSELVRPVHTLRPVGERTSGIWIPRAALVERAGIPGVFVLQDGRARFRMVKVGKHRATQLEVLSGLHGTETLVLGPFEAMHDGSPIRSR